MDSMRHAFVTILVGLCALLVAPSAHADLKTVDVSRGVPSEELPLGSSFLLTTTASKKATAVYAMFVEYADGVWGSRAGSEFESCGAVRTNLRLSAEKLQKLGPGEHRFGAVREASKGSSDDPRLVAFDRRPMLMLPQPATNDEGYVDVALNGKVTLAVPSTSFFKHGAHYCLLISEERREERVDRKLETLLHELDSVVRICAQSSPTGKRPSCNTEILGAESLKGLSKDSLALLGPLAAAAVAFRFAASNVASTLGTAPNDGRVLLPAHRSNDAIPWLDVDKPDPTCANAADPLGQAAATLLLRRGLLVEVGSLIVQPGDKTMKLGGIRVDEAPNLIGRFASPTTTTTITFGLNAKQLNLPGGTATLDDLLHVGIGQIVIADQGVDLRQLGARVDALSIADVTDNATLTTLHAVSARAKALAMLLEKDEGDGAHACTDAGIDPLNRALGRWSTANGVAHRLEQEAASIDRFLRAATEWVPSKAVVKTVFRSLVDQSPIDTTVGLNPRTWVFSYVTPMVGYVATTDSFGVPITGIEVGLFANSADEPMWTNGVKDLRRLVSLELGVAPQTSDFGPNSRYSGPGVLPPLLVGLSLRLIPYTVFSSGLMFVDAKSSTLAGEAARLRAIGYFGLSVEANIPDIILGLFVGKKSGGE